MQVPALLVYEASLATSEPAKALIEQLDDEQDYGLWYLRVEAVCNAKGLNEVLTNEPNPYTEEEPKAKFLENQKKASGIIVSALSNPALRIVRSDSNNPFLMLQKLAERYDSKTAASRIAKMTELITLRYDNILKDMGEHVDKMAGILEKLEGMDTSLPEEFSIALLISSIAVPELIPMTAALKKLSDDDAKWDDVSSRLIEEHQSIKSKRRRPERASNAIRHCPLCSKPGHTIERCWYNPNNPENRLNMVPKQGAQKASKGSEKPKTKKSDSSEKHKNKETQE